MTSPCAHERQHHKSRSHCRIVLISSLGRIPLGQTKYFDKEDGEKNEQYDPQGEKADYHW